jgi:hypothetical protein
VGKHKEVLTYTQYAAMDYDELLRVLKDKFRQAQRLSLWFNELEKLGVLVALQAMHDKVAQPGRRRDLAEPDPKKPTWEDVCSMLGITPNLVRVWRCRTQANTDIRHLLGEEPPRPGAKQPDSASEIRHRALRLAKAVIRGEETEAAQLAWGIVERYEH